MSTAAKAKSQRVSAGLIGSGIQASLTPALHMGEGAEQGLDYRYELFDLDRINGGVLSLTSLINAARDQSFAGLNITHPCKQTVLPFLDDLSDDARALGAVNTIVFDRGQAIGHNTDWWGFAESFRRGLADASLDAVVQLGAGGAGAAVAYAMLKLGARQLSIFDLDEHRAATLVAKLSAQFPQQRVLAPRDLAVSMSQANGLVHATTTGTQKNPGLPLSPAMLSPSHWIVEIVYFPIETELLKVAAATGCRTLDGGGMAVYQAVGAFRLFTGIEPDPVRMARHFDSLAHRPTALSAE
ncbi:MAG TPA: shikimate dehydrogenase [Steroidobacteraceae bacterium]|nr:shikimate dehydrogenase [Steroidobacteraceae bacterium]